MIDLETLVPMPEPVDLLQVAWRSARPFPLPMGDYFAAAQMSTLREQVAREVAKRCAEICERHWTRAADAIAAEFGLEEV